MVERKKELQPSLLSITQRIAELERSTQIDVESMDFRTRRSIFDEIDSLNELYQRTIRIPTWPFDREIFLRFITPQAVPLLSLIATSEPMVSIVRYLVPH